MCVCVPLCVNEVALKVQKRASDPLGTKNNLLEKHCAPLTC